MTLGTYYIHFLLQNYKGEPQEVYISWGILCVISTYNIFTLYYDSLLKGKGLIKRSLQIVVVGNTVYLVLASLLILKGFGLIAIVSAQASSVIIVRLLSYRSFFTTEISQKINKSFSVEKKEILKAITPNSVKIGLTSLAGFMVLRSAIIIGSLNIPLNDIASFSITMQLIGVISGLAGIYAATYQPKIVQFRVLNNKKGIKELYIKSEFALIFSYIIGGAFLLIFGKWGIILIGSKTQLLPTIMILILIIISFLEINHSLAGGILLTKNEVPFFKAALLAGGVTIILLLFLFKYTDIGIWAMILAPGIAQGLYQNWKWPLVVFNELEITSKDFLRTLRAIFNKN
jgi:O-antigen/teichoic acid export membrane protein